MLGGDTFAVHVPRDVTAGLLEWQIDLLLCPLSCIICAYTTYPEYPDVPSRGSPNQ